MSSNSPAQPPRGDMRVSHAEREAVVEQLREAASEGRLEFAELDSRLDAALTAKTHADLAPLTADLPTATPPAPAVFTGGVGGLTKNGQWEVPAHITVHGGLGSAKLDFTRTGCRLPEITIEAHGDAGGVVLIIPDGWAADITGMDPGLGGCTNKATSERSAGMPLIRLHGSGGLGGVTVRNPNRWERRKLANNPPR